MIHFRAELEFPSLLVSPSLATLLSIGTCAHFMVVVPVVGAAYQKLLYYEDMLSSQYNTIIMYVERRGERGLLLLLLLKIRQYFLERGQNIEPKPCVILERARRLTSECCTYG